MAEYIDRDAFLEHLQKDPLYPLVEQYGITGVIESFPAADVLPVVNGQRYNNHEVACIITDIVGDACACNVNGIDEWLPEYCEFRETCCPAPVGVACWEQYLKYKDVAKE